MEDKNNLFIDENKEMETISIDIFPSLVINSLLIEGKQDIIKSIDNFKNDPILFIESITDATLCDYQKELLRKMLTDCKFLGFNSHGKLLWIKKMGVT